MVVKVTLDYEFYEVLNAFPILTKFLSRDLEFNLNDVIEGETVDEYFEKKSLTSGEKSILLRQLNYKIKDFFNTTLSIYDEDDYEEEEELEEEEE